MSQFERFKQIVTTKVGEDIQKETLKIPSVKLEVESIMSRNDAASEVAMMIPKKLVKKRSFRQTHTAA